MKIGCYSDIHASRNDISLNTNNGRDIYKSIKWARNEFMIRKCQLIVNDGDFFDTTNIDAETNSSLAEVYKNNTQEEIIICGNHEIEDKEGLYNSLSLLGNIPKIQVFSRMKILTYGDVNLIFMPYTNNLEYINDLYNALKELKGKKILFSHLTYRNVPNLFLPDSVKSEINYLAVKDNVDLIFNGHIHTALETEKYVQVGLLTGLSFADDYTYHRPGIIILDTDTMTFERVENPYSILYEKGDYKNLNVKYPGRTFLRIDCLSTKLKDVKKQLEKLNLFRYKIQLLVEEKTIQSNQKELNLYSNPVVALEDFIKRETGIFTEEELGTFIKEYYS